MDNSRFFLLLAFVALSFWTWSEWQSYFAEPVPETTQETGESGSTTPMPESNQTPRPDTGPDAPRPESGSGSETDQAPALDDGARESGEIVTVRTAVHDVGIDTLGGAIQRLELVRYKQELDGEEPVRLLTDEPGALFTLQPGLIAAESATDLPGRIPFRHEATWSINAEGERDPSGEGRAVQLVWDGPDGLRVTRTYCFLPDDYKVRLEQSLENTGDVAWRGGSYSRITRTDPKMSRSMFDPDSFSHNGPAFHNGESYERFDFDDLAESNLNRSVTGGWAAMVQHYFVAALIPESPEAEVRYYSDHRGGDRYVIGMADRRAKEVAPGESVSFNQQFYLGPKVQRHLKPAAPHLERVVDFGIMWIIAQPLFTVLSWIHALIGNWGWAIIILTALIKVVFYKLSETSGRSLAKMRKLQPRMTTIRERYQDDKQKMNQALMELYKREKVNPAAGCLPILIQIPVFLALYWTAMESAELRHAPWMLWIQDLSSPDPLYILPTITAAAMFLQQKFNPPPPDPTMRKVMMFMPLMMLFISSLMPSGVVLYWGVNTILSVAQQWKINRVVEAEK